VTSREAAGRTRKAIILTEAALRAGFNAERVATDYSVRDWLVVTTEVRPPSEDTWAVAVTLVDWCTRKVVVVLPEEREEYERAMSAMRERN
jgi:hypothetical protein